MGIASYFLPWWVIAPVCFGLCFWKAASAKQAFAIGGAAVSTLWLVYATYLEIASQASILTTLTGVLSGGSNFLSGIPQTSLGFAIMLFIAGLVGGFSGLAGYQTGQLVDAK